MRLFLFSASVFYMLGLKLTSHINVVPNLFHNPVKIETKISDEPKADIQQVTAKPEIQKKDTIISDETKSSQLAAPATKEGEKQN